MTSIQTFPFKKEKLSEIKSYRFGQNWPVVYILENETEVYIGETTSAYYRSKEHSKNIERLKLDRMHIITDEEYNKSAALDIEAWLIQYMAADGKYILQNGNSGLQNHNYYDKEKYKSKFEGIIWNELKDFGLVKHNLLELKNSDLFKYSPYKSLTDDQFEVAVKIYKELQSGVGHTYVINGKPGTGKTVLAVYLLKFLKEREETKNLKIGLVVPMASLRKTVKKVFKRVKGIKPSMVIGPNDVVKDNYDLLIVDESHRLQRRFGITNYRAFDQVNRKLGLGNEGNQLDWVMKSSKNQIFFYDQNQSVRPADVRPDDFNKIKAINLELTSQLRVQGGEEYINFINTLFDLKSTSNTQFVDYEFKIYENLNTLVQDLKQKDKEFGLSRLVAGYAWPWYSKNDSSRYDIEINGVKLIWNSTAHDWVNSPNAINEVGCIHTVQGYDLNYVGVIIGPELSYDPYKNRILINKSEYYDKKGHAGITDDRELEQYIINIYKTLLTRGIKGTYLYIVDKNLRDYIKSQI